MTDMYNYDNKNNNVERQAKYVHLNNEFTDDIKLLVKDYLKDKCLIVDDTTSMARRNCWYDQAQWRIICQLESNKIDSIL